MKRPSAVRRRAAANPQTATIHEVVRFHGGDPRSRVFDLLWSPRVAGDAPREVWWLHYDPEFAAKVARDRRRGGNAAGPRADGFFVIGRSRERPRARGDVAWTGRRVTVGWAEDLGPTRLSREDFKSLGLGNYLVFDKMMARLEELKFRFARAADRRR